MDIAGGCATLQELELHRCTDLALRPVSAFAHLQILRIVAASSPLYGTSEDGGVTDIGLTILAHGCKRLVKLELVGCEGSYDGIAAVGRCCAMLEELTIAEHRMDGGWLAALAFCGNLKTLRLQGCARIDDDPGASYVTATPSMLSFWSVRVLASCWSRIVGALKTTCLRWLAYAVV
ncbi:hypothetical protein TRIUR3_15728 [Triticum urartu]|uniref:Uncharacterized protein n=1 Tax=Triticum urartu TaxID=4572 RepID=M7YY86_TRIUA|nr:hypothetical protein TRIUR3_15728 [Triticum urartu]